MVLPPGESVDRQRASQGSADRHGDQAGRQADAQRERDDAEKLGIEATDERQRSVNGLGKILHVA
jgi:hypothetical protein